MAADQMFWARVDQTGECWLWTGYTMASGYGQVRRQGVLILAHRYAYEQVVGSIPAGVEVAHRCANRACVRPEHLVVTSPCAGPQRETLTLADRFWAKVEKSDSCWLWTGALFPSNGYGALHLDGAAVPAHRVSYELNVGPIPDGLTIDHLCRVRACVRPDHLEPVTQAENLRRARPYRQAVNS